MKFKLKDLKHKNGKIVAEITIKYKEVIRTKSLDSSTIVNGKSPDSDFRTPFTLRFLDKYHPDYAYGKIVIEYLIFPGVLYSAIIQATFLERIYLNFLFEQYAIQRIQGAKRFIWELMVFITTILVTWCSSKC